MKKIVLLIVLIFYLLIINEEISYSQEIDSPLTLVSVQKIWDKAPHNAFTDLINFNGRWFCVFREGKGHVSNDGSVRIIASCDGKVWESAALMTSPDSDLRDPKITITPEGQLMLTAGSALHDKTVKHHQSLAWFSKDGYNWSKSCPIGDANFWLWRTTWHKDKAYNIGYTGGSVRLYVSHDGKSFETLVKNLYANDNDYPNESSIVFSGDTAFCLMRNDGGSKHGLLGIALPPYTQWKWKDLHKRIGGPDMIRLSDGRLIAAVRLYKPVRTSLCQVDPKAGSITEVLTLPSREDTSYAGLFSDGGLLWVSYFSAHEGKTSQESKIYLAKVGVK